MDKVSKLYESIFKIPTVLALLYTLVQMILLKTEHLMTTKRNLKVKYYHRYGTASQILSGAGQSSYTN